MDIRLIAADMDGTLLDEQKRLSRRNREALQRAVEKGILFVPATGRIFDAIPDVVRTLPFVRYVITVNGGGVYDSVEHKTIYKAEIPNEEALQICRAMREYGTMFDCYLGGRGYMEQRYYDQIDRYCRPEYRPMIRSSRTPVPDLEEFIREHGDVQKMQMFFTDMELRERSIREVEETFPDTVVTSSVVNNMEVNTKAANKGEALRQLCRYLGIDPSQTLAFGDGGNDITMLEAAGVGVAMANGGGDVKAAADRVTLSNEEDGVAVFLENYVL